MKNFFDMSDNLFSKIFSPFWINDIFPQRTIEKSNKILSVRLLEMNKKMLKYLTRNLIFTKLLQFLNFLLSDN